MRMQSLILILSIAWTLFACKNQSFVGSGQSSPQRKAEASESNPASPLESAVPVSRDDATVNEPEGLQPVVPRTDATPSDEVKPGSDGKSFVEYFFGKELPTAQVDIVFVVDTSESMDDEKQRLEGLMSDFLAQLKERNYKLDFQVFMIGEGFNFPDSSAFARLEVIRRAVGSHDALRIVQEFLESPSNDLRSESIKEFVIITDQESDRDIYENFQRFLKDGNVSGRLRLNGFVGFPNSRQSSWCKILAAGRSYIKLGNDPDYGGLMQDICREDWSELLTNLAKSIAKGDRGKKFALKYFVDERQPITVLVNGQKLDSKEFRYGRGEGSVLEFVIVLPADADIQIHYTVETDS